MSIDGRDLFVAPGGVGGKAGTGDRLAGGNLAVSAMLFANYVETRDGLLFVVGGGHDRRWLPNVPDVLNIAVCLLFEAGNTAAGDYTVSVVVRNPVGDERGRATFPVTIKSPGDIVRIPRALLVRTTADQFGAWSAEVEREGRMLASAAFMIRRTGEA